MSIFNTGRYATAAMAEKAAQECSARASYWSTKAHRNMASPPPVSDLAWDAWRSAGGLLASGDGWAEAEARLRGGLLPPGRWWRSHEDYWQMLEGTNWNAATMALFRVGKVKP